MLPCPTLFDFFACSSFAPSVTPNTWLRNLFHCGHVAPGEKAYPTAERVKKVGEGDSRQSASPSAAFNSFRRPDFVGTTTRGSSSATRSASTVPALVIQVGGLMSLAR